MRELKVLALGLAVMVMLGGCSLQDRKWGMCTVTGAALGAAVGGITGGVAVNNSNDDPTDELRLAGIGGGIGAGAVLGGLLGHALCDPVKKVPPPPPPPAKAPPPAPKKVVELKGAHFDFDRATLKPEGKARLDIAVQAMTDDPSLRVVAEGHTDSVGSDQYNQGLSERRAKAARDYLVSKGIDAGRIEARGFGESRPVADNSTDAGRAENRRVEINRL